MPEEIMSNLQIGLRRLASLCMRESNSVTAPKQPRFGNSGRFFARLRRGEEGQSLVETAVVFPLLISIMLGMFSLTMALYSYQQLGYATFAAAQQLGEDRALAVSDPCYQAVNTLMTALPGFTASKFTINMTVADSGGNATYGPFTGSLANGSGCTAAGSGGGASTQLTAGGAAQLSVSYNYTWIPMWLLNLSGNLVSQETVIID
jgi:Flp pilus assembly protein TadG